jgi:hypothetical protein
VKLPGLGHGTTRRSTRSDDSVPEIVESKGIMAKFPPTQIPSFARVPFRAQTERKRSNTLALELDYLTAPRLQEKKTIALNGSPMNDARVINCDPRNDSAAQPEMTGSVSLNVFTVQVSYVFENIPTAL